MRGRPRKLTDAQVEEARKWYRDVKALPTPTAKAASLNISKAALYMIVNGYTYKTPKP